MRTLRYIVLALIFLLLVAAIGGLFLPSQAHVERSILINRDKATVFKIVNSFKNFNKWSPWYELDKNAEYIVSGPNAGVGSKIAWKGNNNVGVGSNEIIESKPYSLIKTIMFFGKSDAPSYATFTFKDEGNKTKVTWAFDNEFGMNVFYRYFGLVVEKMIAPSYEKGLLNLKSYAESLPLYNYQNISEVNVQAIKVYTNSAKVNPQTDNISTEITQSFAKIIAFITQNNLTMNGTPRIITKSFNDEIFEFDAAIPVVDNSLIDESGKIKAQQTYVGKALKIIHKGSYSNFQESYKILNAYIHERKYSKNGDSWEDYITDPTTTTDKDLITHIYQPVL